MSGKKRKAPTAEGGKEPSAKQPKVEKAEKAAGWLQNLVKQQREDKKDMKFNKKRQRFLTDTEKIKQGSEGVLYWMQRDQRVQGDNMPHNDLSDS